MDFINEAMIAAVKQRPSLYDKTDTNYSNRSHIARQWQEIGDEFGIDDIAARKKWTVLRDYFQKTNKQLTIGIKSGLGVDKLKKWYLYDSMRFLLPHLNEKHSLLKRMQEEDSEFSIISCDDNDVLQGRSRRSPSPSNMPTSSSSNKKTRANHSHSDAKRTTPNVTRHGGKKRKITQEQFVNSVHEQVLESISPRLSDEVPTRTTTELIPTPTVSVNDEDELFCKSLVSKIKGLDPFLKLECQAEIQMLILGFMRRSSQQSQETQTDNDTLLSDHQNDDVKYEEYE